MDIRTIAEFNVLVNRQIAWDNRAEKIDPMRPRMRPILMKESSAAPRMSDSDEDTFVFVGEVLALDLVNTEVVVRGKPRDLLATPEDVGQWWRAAQRYYPDMDVM